MKRDYWRGYIDAQMAEDWLTKDRIATAKKSKFLQPLADDLSDRLEREIKVEPYRSGFLVRLPKEYLKLYPRNVDEPDYLCGWLDACGRYDKERNKLTVTGENVNTFIRIVSQHYKIITPKPQYPAKGSKAMRLTMTGSKVHQLLEAIDYE